MSTYTAVVLPDIHFPIHAVPVLRTALAIVAAVEPDEVVVLGDALDCLPFSSHVTSAIRDLRVAGWIEDEVEPWKHYLDELGRHTRRIVHLEGNHEYRVERFCAQIGHRLGADFYEQVAPRKLLSEGRELHWVPYLPPGEGLNEYRFPTTPGGPGLWAVHGWSHGKHATRAHLDRVRSVSVIHGHTHRAAHRVTRCPVTGRTLQAACPGTLSQLQKSYNHGAPTEWTHGVLLVDRIGDHWALTQVGISPDGSAVLRLGGRPTLVTEADYWRFSR